MTRRSLSNLLSGEELSLPQVWDWYEFQCALIGEEKSRVLSALVTGAGPPLARYVGKTREELEDEFLRHTVELGRLVMLGMLVCTEAALRVDFIDRVTNKRKDEVSRRFRRANGKRGIDRIRLEEDILDTWRNHGSDPRIKNAVADFKGALNLRHWLAHGRYWKPKLGRAGGYDPVDVFDICKQLLQAAAVMPADTTDA